MGCIALADEVRDLYEPQIDQLGLEMSRKDGFLSAEGSRDWGRGRIAVQPLYRDCAAFVIEVCPSEEVRIRPKSVDHGCIARVSRDSARHLGGFARCERTEGFAAYSHVGVQDAFSIMPGERYRSVSLCFLPSFLERVEQEYGRGFGGLFEKMLALPFDHLSSDLATTMAGLSDRWLGTSCALIYYRAKLLEALALLNGRANACEAACEGQGQRRQRRLVDEAKSLVEREIERNLTIEQMAERLFVSRSHLSAAFVAEVGMPIGAWARELKLSRARALLSDPNRSIASVAHSVGFRHVSSFSKAFKASTGLSPSQWRAL